MYDAIYTPFYKEKPFFAPYVYSVWHVKRDCDTPSFSQQLRGGKDPNNLYGIFKTHAGKGYLKTKKQTYYLTEDTLILLRIDDIETYRAEEGVWEYFCYNFVPNTSIPFFKTEVLYSLSKIYNEQTINKELLHLINFSNIYNANYASSLFCNLLFAWIYHHQANEQAKTPYAREINNCISFINKNLALPLKISDLAKQYNLSTRTFERAFQCITKTSPKAFIIDTKMKHAIMLLETTTLSIEAIADEIGYYSSFQFSRDFKKSYGLAPSLFRKSKNKFDLMSPPTNNT